MVTSFFPTTIIFDWAVLLLGEVKHYSLLAVEGLPNIGMPLIRIRTPDKNNSLTLFSLTLNGSISNHGAKEINLFRKCF